QHEPRRSRRHREGHRRRSRTALTRKPGNRTAGTTQYACARQQEERRTNVSETRYTPEFAEEVCRRMAEGASLRESAAIMASLNPPSDNGSATTVTASLRATTRRAPCRSNLGRRDHRDHETR